MHFEHFLAFSAKKNFLKKKIYDPQKIFQVNNYYEMHFCDSKRLKNAFPRNYRPEKFFEAHKNFFQKIFFR